MFRYLRIQLVLLACILLSGIGAQTEGIVSGVAIGGTEGILNAGSTGATPASYTFIGDGTTATSSLTATFSMTAPAGFYIVASANQNNIVPTSITVNGTLLTSILTNSDIVMWTGTVASSGSSNNIVVVSPTGPFSQRDIYVWQASGLSSTTPQQTSTNGTISVTAGYFLFYSQFAFGDSGSHNCNSSTQTPAENQNASGQSVGSDWIIASTNPSFSIVCNVGGNSVAATFH